ncbi:hypothetical protein BaRGS_00009202 [Batillaria attramentaria]|uniref:Uncharacterized protein n=1 Tax=Batillaria attramentaria TaxID=370345 RepID=A0ABD0LJ55_9CAEN
MGTPDSGLPDRELASLAMRGSPGPTGDEDEHRSWSRIGLPDPSLRPSTTGLLPGRQPFPEEWLKPRPFTASHTSFQTEELKSVFEAAFRRYQRIYGEVADCEQLYTNSGDTFEEKWHERIIESRPQTSTGGRVPAPSEQRRVLQEKRQQVQTQQEKEQLGTEQPFRLRMGNRNRSRCPSRQQRQVVIDPWVLDPRNPRGLRPYSSKSIPSKCSRYVLLTRPRTGTGMPPPTPLEEELIATRFPEQSERLLQSAGAAIRPTPPHANFGIPYTPFMYG